MAKWLAIAGAVLLVLLLLMWRQLDSSSAAPSRAPLDRPTTPEVASPSAPIVRQAAAVAGQPAPSEPAEPAASEEPKKLDPMGDEFFYKFIELVPAMVSRQAAICYDGKLGSKHRNQKLTLAYNVHVRDGEVTLQNIKVEVSTLNDPALESCFIQQVARTTWKNPQLPDYDWPDQLVIRPERGLKKYLKENIEYRGEEAPKKDFSVHPSPK
ncbi:MAG: hypothetical protein H6Q90_4531 [Deltaproteobacteria bacterium]|nr:hypothetical protein [Deltaproteobacteria bacterium]